MRTRPRVPASPARRRGACCRRRCASAGCRAGSAEDVARRAQLLADAAQPAPVPRARDPERGSRARDGGAPVLAPGRARSRATGGRRGRPRAPPPAGRCGRARASTVPAGAPAAGGLPRERRAAPTISAWRPRRSSDSILSSVAPLPQLLQTVDLVPREVVEGKLLERSPPPESKRLLEHLCGLGRRSVVERTPPVVDESLEALCVHGDRSARSA